MICVGIDVAKDKHDCFILSSEGEALADVFTIQNNAEGFDRLLQTIRRCTSDFCLTKAYPPTSSIRCTPTSTEKV